MDEGTDRGGDGHTAPEPSAGMAAHGASVGSYSRGAGAGGNVVSLGGGGRARLHGTPGGAGVRLRTGCAHRRPSSRVPHGRRRRPAWIFPVQGPFIVGGGVRGSPPPQCWYPPGRGRCRQQPMTESLESAGLPVGQLVGDAARGGWTAVHSVTGRGMSGVMQQELEIWATPCIRSSNYNKESRHQTGKGHLEADI